MTDGDALESEAASLVEAFNEAAPDYASELEWFGMSLDRDNESQQFVLEAESYVDMDGLAALRNLGRTIRYIEAYEYDGAVWVQIHVPVRGETGVVTS